MKWRKRRPWDGIREEGTNRIEGSVLQCQYQEEINQNDIKIRVLEKTGRSMKSLLQRSGPFKPRKCGRALCFICETKKKGSCDKNEVNYVITCVGCENSGKKGEYRVFLLKILVGGTRFPPHLGKSVGGENIRQFFVGGKAQFYQFNG